jgi:hypothetical protein
MHPLSWRDRLAFLFDLVILDQLRSSTARGSIRVRRDTESCGPAGRDARGRLPAAQSMHLKPSRGSLGLWLRGRDRISGAAHDKFLIRVRRDTESCGPAGRDARGRLPAQPMHLELSSSCRVWRARATPCTARGSIRVRRATPSRAAPPAVTRAAACRQRSRCTWSCPAPAEKGAPGPRPARWRRSL